MRGLIAQKASAFALFLVVVPMSLPAFAANQLSGRAEGAGRSIVDASVTLWLAGAGAPRKISEARTKADGSFELNSIGEEESAGAGVLYLIAEGGKIETRGGEQPNPAIKLMATFTEAPRDRVTINELTTVASVWTAAQFLDGTSLSGNVLGLRIAAGNVPNLVDLKTGGLGTAIQDPLNSSQTTTLAKFNTLGILLSACITAMPNACSKLFAAATTPAGAVPTDTLSAARNIARFPWHKADELFALLDEFYPVPPGGSWRDVAHIPYLNYAPGAWTLSLVYAGGGLNSLGGIAVDGEGNLWADDNFLVGAQSTIFESFGGGLSKLAPNGRPLSPMTTGFRGGGIDGPGFGIAISADDKVWATSLAGKTISVFDRKTGEPLSPETGYDFDGQLGQMQGIIVTPSGDVWALDNENSQIVYLPQGDASKGRILGRTKDGKPTDGTLEVKAPFHLAIDQKDRIWVTNSGSNTVTRFPASNPGKAEHIEVGFAPRAVAIDSQGNAWVANTVGHPSTPEKAALIKTKLEAMIASRFSSASEKDRVAREWIDLYEILVKYPGGDISMIRPDGTVLPPFDGDKSIIGPWGVAVDGNDNIWVANATGRSIVQLCGARTENCPPGFRTGDRISPPGGYTGGLQILTDVDIDPAGNVWVANNWDLPEEAGFKEVPPEALSTRFGGNGAVVFFGLAKPVRAPLIGPVQAP
jgi:DNA-binding beta-propeller fold protein YncE